MYKLNKVNNVQILGDGVDIRANRIVLYYASNQCIKVTTDYLCSIDDTKVLTIRTEFDATDCATGFPIESPVCVENFGLKLANTIYTTSEFGIDVCYVFTKDE